MAYRVEDRPGLSLFIAVVVMAAIVLSACIIAGCGEEGPKAGIVTKHEYDDPDDYYVAGVHIPGSCSYVDNVRTCSADVNIPGHWEHDGPHWLLYIESADTDEDGKPDKKGWREVDETTYHRCQNGEWCDTQNGTG